MTESLGFGSIISPVKTLSGIARGWFNLAYRKAKKELQKATERQQFEIVYAPLRMMLLDIHITTGQSIRYPYFSWRWRRAVKSLTNGNYRLAFSRLFDKGKSELSDEVEYGGLFPLGIVKKILTENPHLVSTRLMDL